MIFSYYPLYAIENAFNTKSKEKNRFNANKIKLRFFSSNYFFFRINSKFKSEIKDYFFVRKK